MGLESNNQKVKVTFECSLDDRAYIKMLAANEHVTISEYMLSRVRPEFPNKKPNAETLQAMEDSRNGKTVKCKSLEDFWKKLGVKPSAYN